jgi:hypothetical protein
MKKIRTAPPKKELKKTSVVRPLRRERPIELIAVKRAITSAFTVKLPEVSGASYSPQIAVVSIPEPAVAAEKLPSLWEREMKLKEREIRLESFGVTTLKPLGTAENPITRIQVQITAVGCGNDNELGVCYPEDCQIATGLTGDQSMNLGITIGPYAVPPQDVIFYLTSPQIGYRRLLSTDPNQCRRTPIGPNAFLYEWEDLPPGQADFDYNDVVMRVFFMGAEGGW